MDVLYAQQVRDYLDLFPNARFFIIGMGTNDLGTWPDTEAASRRIIGNLSRMVQMVLDRGKQPILFNVPHVNEQMFPPRMAREVRYYVDGVLVRSVENTHWHQPLFLIFDSETMPQWFGMPDDDDLPSTFSVEYVRAWKLKQ